MSVPKKGQPWKHLADSFPETSFGIGTLLEVGQSRLEKPTQGCVIYTVVIAAALLLSACMFLFLLLVGISEGESKKSEKSEIM